MTAKYSFSGSMDGKSRDVYFFGSDFAIEDSGAIKIRNMNMDGRTYSGIGTVIEMDDVDILYFVVEYRESILGKVLDKRYFVMRKYKDEGTYPGYCSGFLSNERPDISGLKQYVSKNEETATCEDLRPKGTEQVNMSIIKLKCD